jgi:DNA invertase Pin-like site-specific DNA recombinase
MTKKLRVALYARISTINHGQDAGLQLAELRAVAVQRGWTIVGEFVDEGISGTVETRPALDRMMNAARSGKVDAVMVWRFDRFARSTQHLLAALDEFRRLGIDFISLREQIDTSTPLGRAVFTIVAAVATLERELIIERVRAGVAHAKASGTHCGRPRRELDLRAAHVLLGQGHSVRQAATMLGIPRGTLMRRIAEEAGSKVPSSDASDGAQ